MARAGERDGEGPQANGDDDEAMRPRVALSSGLWPGASSLLGTRTALYAYRSSPLEQRPRRRLLPTSSRLSLSRSHHAPSPRLATSTTTLEHAHQTRPPTARRPRPRRPRPRLRRPRPPTTTSRLPRLLDSPAVGQVGSAHRHHPALLERPRRAQGPVPPPRLGGASTASSSSLGCRASTSPSPFLQQTSSSEAADTGTPPADHLFDRARPTPRPPARAVARRLALLHPRVGPHLHRPPQAAHPLLCPRHRPALRALPRPDHVPPLHGRRARQGPVAVRAGDRPPPRHDGPPPLGVPVRPGRTRPGPPLQRRRRAPLAQDGRARPGVRVRRARARGGLGAAPRHEELLVQLRVGGGRRDELVEGDGPSVA